MKKFLFSLLMLCGLQTVYAADALLKDVKLKGVKKFRLQTRDYRDRDNEVKEIGIKLDNPYLLMSDVKEVIVNKYRYDGMTPPNSEDITFFSKGEELTSVQDILGAEQIIIVTVKGEDAGDAVLNPDPTGGDSDDNSSSDSDSGGAAADAARAGTFSVTIRDLADRTLSIDGLTPETTVAKLKKEIKTRGNIPVDQQRLVFAGNEFEDGKTLQNYGVCSDVVIHLILRRAGSGGGNEAGVGRAAAAVTVAALTAAVKSIMSLRSYRRMKNKLVRKYDLGNLTDLQDKVWMATFLAHRMPYFLHRLVRNNAGKSLTDFTGKNPRALVHFYYGHKPSQAEYDDFIAKFFSSVNQ